MKNSKQTHGDLGQHWTPPDTVDFMMSLSKNCGRTLEPSAGSGRFLRAFADAGLDYVACEFDESVASEEYDYVLGNFFDYPLTEKFDSIIGNPPYVAGKLLSNDWLSDYKGSCSKTANAYLHFIDKCIDHLNDNGELIFIVPNTLLGSTSLGSKVRDKMHRLGALTHYYETSTEWEKAAIATCIFRFEKTATQGHVETNTGQRLLTYNNGFMWLIDYKYKGTFSDYFNIMVGSAPPSTAIGDKGEPYFHNGKYVLVDETNKSHDTWPRIKETTVTPKIFFNSGPTRKETVFWTGTTNKHISYCMIPKWNASIKELDTITAQMNDWFYQKREDINLVNDGRFSIGVNQFKSLPMPSVINIHLDIEAFFGE